jgi:uroporphyrin-III C-methyltransferase/precorrin-2 dehydrogenase/sirohydrochlorin ferrochelatase/uroporphyrin-III C-methyltransferase
MSNHTNHIGKVILAGAGPGDPELLTVKTLRWLQRADVIVVDRLVSPDILKYYARREALVIPVGKQYDNAGSTPQSAISGLLVRYALEGKLVVRLKGGDVCIFSNVLDELRALIRHQIPYELVPGVTAALGAAAYAGIPLTARGYATSVRFLTNYEDHAVDADYRELAQTNDTLVFYMSSAPLDRLIEKLLHQDIAADKWVAVIEQATTPMQRVSAWPIHAFLPAMAGVQYASPTLIIIGRVASLHADFQWLADGRKEGLYFPPVPAPASASRDAEPSKKITLC